MVCVWQSRQFMFYYVDSSMDADLVMAFAKAGSTLRCFTVSISFSNLSEEIRRESLSSVRRDRESERTYSF